MMWCDTRDMLANAMTKVVTSYDILHGLLDTGVVKFMHNIDWHPGPSKALENYSEADLLVGRRTGTEPASSPST